MFLQPKPDVFLTANLRLNKSQEIKLIVKRAKTSPEQDPDKKFVAQFSLFPEQKRNIFELGIINLLTLSVLQTVKKTSINSKLQRTSYF